MALQLIAHEEAMPSVYTPPRAGQGRLRKIGLLGSHEATLKHAPWDDPSWELWGHASARAFYKRAPERLFDLHRRECWTKSNHKGQKYLDFLARNTVPIYMQERYPEIPASIRFPLERLQAEFRYAYFTSHAAYMIALALMEGVTHIGFFGVNYGKVSSIGADCEYGTQRGSCEYWMGVAEGRGVQMVLPKGSTLLADPKELYGYESHDEDGLLVESYRARTWFRPTGRQRAELAAMVTMPNGLEAPPANVAAESQRERETNPPPAGCFAAQDVP